MRERRSMWVRRVVFSIGIVTLFVLWVWPAHAWKFLPQEKIFVYPRIDGVGYLAADKPQGMGAIVATRAERTLTIGENVVVYVDVGTRDGIQVGDQLLVFSVRRSSDLRDHWVIFIEGRLRVTEVAESEAAALVVEAYRSISLGSRVDRFHPLEPRIPLKSAVMNLEGVVVGSYEGQITFGEGDIVFLDRGSIDGLEPGQCYQLFRVPMEWTDKLSSYAKRKRGLKRGASGEHLTTPVGELVVIRTEETTATALITDSLLPMNAGERFRPGCKWEPQLVEGPPVTPPTPAAPTPAAAPEEDIEKEDVHFAFDSYVLDERAREILQKKAQILKATPGIQVLIEGHCDERGTEQYNLALGDRRADAAKQYLVNLGISEERMRTISYGEERPLDPGHNERAWGRNRRAHFVILNP